MLAARRFTAMRTCTTAMTPNASAAADRNTNRLTIMVEPSPVNWVSRSNTAFMSDPEVAHLVHDDIARQHPAGGQPEAHLGEALIPDAGIEVRRHHVEQEEDRDRQAGQEQRRELAFRGERLDLAPHLEALADHARQVLE